MTVMGYFLIKTSIMRLFLGSSAGAMSFTPGRPAAFLYSTSKLSTIYE